MLELPSLGFTAQPSSIQGGLGSVLWNICFNASKLRYSEAQPYKSICVCVFKDRMDGEGKYTKSHLWNFKCNIIVLYVDCWFVAQISSNKQACQHSECNT